MNESNIVEFAGRDAISDPVTELLRKGARELLQSAVEAGLEVFMVRFRDRKTAEGHAAVVRNGHHPERAVQTGIGPVTVKVPRVRSKTGKPVTFHSALVPPYVRKARSLEAALPWLYLKGISTGEMDGVRESTQSWREVLLALGARGPKTPKLAIGDGAMGFWAALEEIFPATRQPRCWVHKTANVLNCLPRRSQPKAKKMLHDIH